MINCPNCGKPLGEIPPSGVLVAMCGNCRFKFEARRGIVTGFHTERITVRERTHEHSASYRRTFLIRLELPSGRVEEIGHESAHDDDIMHLQRGDRIAVIYTMRRERREELVTVVNYTTGAQVTIARPGSKSAGWSMMGGLFVAVVGAIVIAPIGLPMWVMLGAGGAAGIGAFMGLRSWLRPVHEIAADERHELEVEQSLLEHKSQLDTARERVRGDRGGRAALRARLVALQEKMRAVNLPAYVPRIEAIGSALRTLDEQIALDDRLLAEYDRTIKIVEIEHETASAGMAMSDDVSAVLLAQREELRTIEETQAELARQLSANVEVEQLLRAPGR
jgi:hypothetical protein